MLAKWLVYRRLPWVRAADPRDCGPAVFASLARYYGHHLTLEQARGLVATDRNGTSLAGLRDGGRAIGFDARPAQAIYESLQHVPLPAIAHLDGGEGHYIVVVRWTPRHVVVLDPNRGAVKLSRAQFEATWSGYLVVYRPTPALRPRAAGWSARGQFVRLAMPHRWLLLAALLFALLATSLGWTTAFFLRVLLDQILPQHATSLLLVLGLALVLVSGFQAVLQWGRLWLAADVGKRVQARYGEQYIRHLFRLPMHVFDARCVPGLVMRITQAELIQLGLTEGMLTLLTDSLLFVTALGVIAWNDPMAALLAAAAVPLVLLVLLLLNDRVYTTQLAAIVRMEEFNSHMIDAFDGLRTIKTFGAEGRYAGLLIGKHNELAAARLHNRVAMALPTAWSLLAASAITAAILWYGSSRVLAGTMSTGELLVLFSMVAFYLMPVQRLPQTVLQVRSALIGVERLEEIGELPAEAERAPEPIELPRLDGRITFDRVNFAYNPYQPVVHDVSFDIAPGETVAIVGETGSGKTSLANLLTGFYLPTEGDVLLDGISTRRLEPDALRTAISAVFQDSKLLQHSIRDNITLLGDHELADIRRAAQVANADTFIERLLNGYETQVARAGDNLSSGQQQRIALARALLKDAPILILDEATSNLDGATEQGILQALAEVRRDRTTVLIAHRLSTVLIADRILVMDAGRLVEQGTHAELLARRGRYWALFATQLQPDAADHAG